MSPYNEDELDDGIEESEDEELLDEEDDGKKDAEDDYGDGNDNY